MSPLDRLNTLPPEEAERELLSCCASRAWVRRMAEARPFRDADAMLEKADEAWWSLGEEDWREAFRGHPRIGEREAEGGQGAREQAWSAGEQAGMRAAADETRRAMAEGNRAYEERFGHIYLVCATGRGADEMLALLHARLGNDPAAEIRVAAAEQAKITRLRLEKLLAAHDP